MTYDDFEDRVVAVLKHRSKNYTNTNCSITELVLMIYQDIINTVHLDWIKDGYIVTNSDIMVIRRDNEENDDPETTTEEYGIPYDIVDDENYTITGSLQRIEDCTFKWVDLQMQEQLMDKTIYFIRPVDYKLQNLPPRLYRMIFQAVIEGVMYEIATAIPTQVDDLVSNRYYQRYYNEKQNLINRLPQINFIEKQIPARERVYDGRHYL